MSVNDQAKQGDPAIVAVTIGDIAGIGPEVTVRALSAPAVKKRVLPLVIGHPQIVAEAAALVGTNCEVCPLEDEIPVETAFHDPTALRRSLQSITQRGAIACMNPSFNEVLNAPRGQVSAAAGQAAYDAIRAAIQLARGRCVDAICTAPLNKEALHLAGHRVPGHTEILAAECGVSEFAMMLHLADSALAPWRALIGPATNAASHGLSIAHVTLHTSVASVPGLLTVPAVCDTIRLMAGFLRRIGCNRSSIAVAALNPHGGEHGLFGNEEHNIIEPAVELCRREVKLPGGLHGPLPVDTLMRRAVAGEFDGLVVMYHDQGHIPIKLLGFDRAVNITLGLPIVRTSPTHGTAFDRAWNPETPADARGMVEALLMAASLSESSTHSQS
jgi:4-hydroxythreonine-4-phosphate dehydrogenase